MSFDARAIGRKAAEQAGHATHGQNTNKRPPTLVTAEAFVSGFVPPAYTIDGLVQSGRLYSVTGPTGHGKTAVALSLNIHVAGEKQILGRRVERGNCVYLAAENPEDVKARMILMTNRLALNLSQLPLWFVEGAFNLEDWTDPIRKQVDAIGGASLVTVDTSPAFLACCGFDEENDNMQALRFALQLRALTELPGRPAVLALCHPTKHATRDNLLPRGGGAFLNEMDTNHTLWADGDRATTELSWCAKIRGPTFDPITFALEGGTCSGLVDAEGRNIPSVWSYPVAAEVAEKAAEHQRGDEDSLLLLMDRVPAGSLATWAAALGWVMRDGSPAKYRVQRALDRLKTEGMAMVRRGRWTLTKAGKAEAKKVEEAAK